MSSTHAIAHGPPIERAGLRRVAWSVWALAMAFGGLYVLLFLLNRGTRLPGAGLELVQSPPFIVVGGTIGALVASRRRDNPIGWLLLYMASGLALQEVLEHYAILSYLTRDVPLPGARWAAWVQSWILETFFPIPLAIMLMLFPDGRFPSARWRRLAVAGLAVNAVGLVVMVLTPGSLSPACCARALPVTNPVGLTALSGAAEAAAPGPSGSYGAIAIILVGLVVMLPAAVASLAIRRRRGSAEVRSQIGLVMASIALVAALFLAGVAISLAVSTRASSGFFTAAITLLSIALPGAVGLGILRYRLFDVEVVIRKTVVFGTLAAFVTLVYVAVVIGIGSAITGSTTNPATIVTFAGAAVLAVVFQPLRVRANRLANRMVYGKRATPYEALAEFSERVGGTQAEEEVLDRMAQVLGEAVGAERSVVWLRVGREFRDAASWPPGAGPSPAIPFVGDDVPEIRGMSHAEAVRDGTEVLGALAVRKPPNDPITASETRLVAHLASQAALVLRNVRLIEELRASRQRLVHAQDEERRRLERNIHDGAQQQLVALAVKLRLVEQLTERDPARAREVAVGLQAEAQTALEDLRDLARGIYPPLLADQGLPAALEAQAGRAVAPVAVEADGVGRFARAIEAAVYFCCLEALQNAAKYAGGSPATVRLGFDGVRLTFEVADEGPGFDPGAVSFGTGLQGMVDRVEAIGGRLEVRSSPGGGTVVAGSVPAALA